MTSLQIRASVPQETLGTSLLDRGNKLFHRPTMVRVRAKKRQALRVQPNLRARAT